MELSEYVILIEILKDVFILKSKVSLIASFKYAVNLRFPPMKLFENSMW